MELLNTSFEATEWTHDCIIVPSVGDPYKTERGNIFSPQHWTTWFKHDPGIWDQPEVRDAWKAHDPRRVHSGNKAILLFTFFRRHGAGFLQQVSVTPGTRLCLSAFAHAWSNHSDGPHSDDPRWSEGVGYEEVSIASWDVPPLIGDPQNDAIGNFAFNLGIDPQGGINPEAPGVIWGDFVCNYNAHFPVPPVEAVAISGTITVFLRSTTLWAFKHNDAYWDDIMLEILPPDQRGTPRIQYERTYVLLPQHYSPEWIKAAGTGGYNDRLTVGYSADDAGIGDLDKRNVIAVNPDEWLGDLEGFYREFYPGVNYLPLHVATPAELESALGKKPTHLLQCNPSWADKKFGDSNCSRTICQAGCFITGLAEAQRRLGIKTDATPVTVNAALGPSGYRGCRPLHSALPSALGLRIVGTTGGDAHLAKGNLCLAEVKPTSLEHFVLVTKEENGRYWMVDPLQKREGWLDDSYLGVESWRLLEKVTTPPPPRREPISLHLQKRVRGDSEYIQAVQPGAVKLVFNMEEARHIKALSPETQVVYRQWVPDQGQFMYHPGGVEVGAGEYLATFLDSLKTNAQWIDYAESLNETVATGDAPGIQRTVDFDIAFCNALRDEGYPARPAVLTVAVGNPQHGAETELLLPAARAAVNAGGVVAYHPYWGSRPGFCTMDKHWRHYAGRALESWDPVFRAAGVFPRYLFGECGAVGISEGGAMNAGAGWRHPSCLDGNWNLYLEQILEFRRRLLEWNAAHNNRVIGATIFTSGGGKAWQWFEFGEPQMQALAAVV